MCFYGRIEPRIKILSKRYQNAPKFDIWCDLTPNRLNMNFQLIMRWFVYSSLRVVFLWQNWIIFQIFKFQLISLIYVTDMIRDSNKMKYNHFFFCLDDADTKNKMNNANTKKLKGTLKNENNRRIWSFFGA